MIHEMIIVGSGPAGYTAAIYAGRSNRKPLVIAGFQAGGQPGGQLMTTTDIENFPGFPEGIAGSELMQRMQKQAERFGAQVVLQDVISVDFSKRPFRVTTAEASYEARSVIVATGAAAKRLGTEAERRYWNKGISACATCDGALPLFRQQPLAVIGGGDTAMEEALHLTRFGSKVTIIHRRNEFRASPIMFERAKNHPKIELLTPYTLENTEGDDFLKSLVLRKADGTTVRISTSGLFLGIGHEPNTAVFNSYLKRDAEGYLVTDGNARTNVPGVFAAGDCVDHIYRQAITAAGQGCMAALEAERYLETVAHEAAAH